MTSILTNIAAMSALQTLRSIDTKMEDTQARVSSGLRVGTASDNAAYWSIATTMRSDNGALSAVEDALGLGAAKVDTAYAAMESVVDVVEEIKNKLVAASEAGVDKAKIQEEISQLQDQLRSIASSASFSGENWLEADIGGATNADGFITAGSPATKQVVASFIRDASGNVSVRTIGVTLNEENVLFDLSGGKAGLLDSEGLTGVRNSGLEDTNGTDIYVNTVTYDTSWVQNNDIWVDPGTDATDTSDDTHYVKIDGAYILSDTAGNVDITGTNVASAGDIGYAAGISVVELDITKLADYQTEMGLANEADVMDYLVQFVNDKLEDLISSTAKLGSISMRIDMQEDFVSKLTDSIDSGIGRLVDADMNEESTRLKALQTQQQLAIQALSIANTSSENILSLFRQ